MEKHQKTLFWALLFTEASHIFCCVLPTLFSVISLLAGLGLVSTMPVGLEFLHENLHEWEVPMLFISALILVIGWGLYFYSQKIDCHETGCHHGPCDATKRRTNLVLRIATVLFLVNITVYGLFHREGAMLDAPARVEAEDGSLTGHSDH